MEIDTKKIDAWKKTINDEYETKLKELKEDRKKKLEAINIVMELESFKTGVSETQVNSDTIIRRRSNPEKKVKLKRPMTHLIKREILKTTGVFDKNTISGMMKEARPEVVMSHNSFRSLIVTMINNNELEEVEKGAGKRATTYQRITSSSN